MPFEIGTATDYLDLLHRLQRFVCGHGTWSSTPQFTGEGPGMIQELSTSPATVTETWTITCTNADAPGEEIWTVSGSVTGATTDATTGAVYDNGVIGFQITGTGYAAGDQFAWNVTQGAMSAAGAAWTLMGKGIDPDWDHDVYFRAPGESGTEQIHLQIAAYHDVGNDYYNWSVSGALGYEPQFDFNGQPGRSPNTYTLLWQSEIPYWLVVNGQRLVLVAKVSTTYQVLYLGKIMPYGTPAQFPYPVLVGAATSIRERRWSSSYQDESLLFNPGQGTYLYTGSGGWKRIMNRYGTGSTSRWYSTELMMAPTHQYAWGKLDSGTPDWRGSQIQPAPDGSYFLLPFIPLCTNNDYASVNQYGELDGVFWITGTGNGSENTLTIDGDDYLVVQNMHRTNWTEYGAVRLS